MLGLFSRIVEKRPIECIVVVLIITALFATALPNISFKTDVTKFLPDNELVRANDRITEHFGEDFYPHIIYAKAANPEQNVLTPRAIREEYFLIQEARALENVDGTLSLADALNEISRYRLNQSSGEVEYKTWYSLNQTYQGEYVVDDDEVQSYLDLLFGVLDGSINITELADQLGGDMPLAGSVGVEDLEFIMSLLLSKDFTIESQKALGTIIIVQMNGTLSNVEAKNLAGQILEKTEAVETREITFTQTSQYLLSYDVDKNSEDTFRLLAGGIFGLIMIILAFSFKRFSYVILPMLTLLIATIWTLGSMYYLGLNFTAMVVAVIPLLIGLGVDYSVHVSRRYQEELRKGGRIASAVTKSIIFVGGAIALAMITTVIAFLSNVTSAVIPIRDFGISCALGVFFAFLLTMTFYGALRFLADKRAVKKYKKGKGKSPIIGSWHTEKGGKLDIYDKVSNGISNAVRNHPIPIILLIVILSLGSVYGAINVRSEFTLEEFLPDDWESVQAADAIRQDFEVGSYAVSFILIEGDDVATVETYRGVVQAVQNVENDKHVVKIDTSAGPKVMTESIIDLAKTIMNADESLQTEFNFDEEGHPTSDCTNADIKAFFNYIYDNTTTTDPFTGQTFGDKARKVIHRTSFNYDSMVIRIYVNTYSSTDNREMHQELKDDASGANFGSGKEVTITGLMVLTISIVDSLQQNMINSTILAVILAAIILMFLYRSVILGLLPCIPVVVSSFWIIGTMYALGFSLNILTVMVTALTIGLGIDYSIHVLERFKEEREHSGTQEAIHTTIMSTGTALTISALTTVLGFAVLVFSPMPVAQQFGIITAITIIYSYLLAVLALPVILIARENFRGNAEEPTKPQFTSLKRVVPHVEGKPIEFKAVKEPKPEIQTKVKREVVSEAKPESKGVQIFEEEDEDEYDLVEFPSVRPKRRKKR